MLKKILPYLVFPSLIMGFLFVPPLSLGISIPSFEDMCDMDGCKVPLSGCHLCSSFGPDIPCAHQAAGFHFTDPSFSLVPVIPDHLSNQEFIKLIFRPPKIRSLT